ncbi:MAG: hypothetical protein CME01_08025 [Geminicoccus sp.]|nr:hypothetical protein [Geminicoccus sp.]
MRTMTQNKWTYSSSYDDKTPRCTHTNSYSFSYDIEGERSASSRIGAVLGFATTILCIVVIGLIYAIYF